MAHWQPWFTDARFTAAVAAIQAGYPRKPGDDRLARRAFAVAVIFPASSRRG